VSLTLRSMLLDQYMTKRDCLDFMCNCGIDDVD